MRRIVVSGASGFLGSNLVSKALSSGIEVVAITSKPSIRGGATIVSTEEFLSHGYSFTSQDVFINCLFPTNADGYKLANGLDAVFWIVSRAYEYGIGAFINISSQSVYASKRTSPAKETDPLCLETPYAVGKYSSEAFVNQVFSDRPHVNIRMASLLGVGYDQRIVNRMVSQAMKGEPLKVIGGMQRYGFLDVRDAAAGLIKLALRDTSTWKETYNLGGNESYSLIDVVECIVSEMKKEADMDVTYTVAEGQDDRNSAIDATLFMSDFNWKPEIMLSGTTATIIRSKLGR